MAFFVKICPILAKIFKKFQLQNFFGDYIHGLHLCDNFGVFNINIEDFIDENSEKITKNDPPFSYIKVKTPKIELVITSERSWILTFRKKRWNHSNQFYKISLTCFFDSGPPITWIFLSPLSVLVEESGQHKQTNKQDILQMILTSITLVIVQS